MTMMMMMMMTTDLTDAGWSRKQLRANSERVQPSQIHSWRLNGPPQWDEIQHKVRFKP